MCLITNLCICISSPWALRPLIPSPGESAVYAYKPQISAPFYESASLTSLLKELLYWRKPFPGYIIYIQYFLASSSFLLIASFLRILQGASSCFQFGAITQPFIAPGYFTDVKEKGEGVVHIFFRGFELPAVKRERKKKRGVGVEWGIWPDSKVYGQCEAGYYLCVSALMSYSTHLEGWERERET